MSEAAELAEVEGPAHPATPPGIRAGRQALLVFLGTLAFYLLQQHGRTYGDDVFFVQCVVRDYPFAPHFLFMPLLRASSWLLAHVGIDPFVTSRLLSSVGMAAGAGFLVLAGRSRGLTPRAALLLALLPATASSTLFFATAAEVHGPHVAAVSLGLWLLARLRPDSSVRDVFLAWLSFGLVVGTHQSGALLLPGLVAGYLLATPGRPGSLRVRDALALGIAGLISVAAMLVFRTLETGHAFAAEDSPAWFVEGIRAKLARGYGLEEMASLLSEDFVTALPLTLAGALAAGVLARTAPRRFLALLVVLLPYFLFFALFGYHERGAYHLVTLPLYAAALVHVAGTRPRISWAAGVIALLGWATSDQLTAWLTPTGPAVAFLVTLAAGALLAGRRKSGATPTVLAPLALLLLTQVVGSVRTLSAHSAETPLLDWLRGVCRANRGRETYLVVADFQRNWSLRLVDEPWPEPWAGTWPLLDEVPLPGPHGFVYGDPGLPSPAFRATVAELLGQGVEIWIDDSVREFLAQKPGHGADLEFLESTFGLEPLTDGAFRGERVIPPGS